jgi:hypothetical protein
MHDVSRRRSGRGPDQNHQDNIEIRARIQPVLNRFLVGTGTIAFDRSCIPKSFRHSTKRFADYHVSHGIHPAFDFSHGSSKMAHIIPF